MAAAPPPTGPARAWLDLARAAFFEELYRGKSVLWVGVGDGRPIEVLLERGAQKVVGVDLDAQTAQAAEKRLGGRAEVKSGAPSAAAGRYDLVMCGCGELVVQRAGFIAQLLDRLAPGGWLVVAAASADAAGAQGGVGYYELLDKIAPHFRAVTMMGQGALAGATVAPFGDEEAEPVLDAGLAGSAEATLYVAVAGPRRAELGYGLIVLPPEAAEAGEQGPNAEQAEKIERLEAELKGVGPALVRAREEAEARRRTEARAAEMERNLHLREHRIAELLSEATVRGAQLEQARAKQGELERIHARGRELETAWAAREGKLGELEKRLHEAEAARQSFAKEAAEARRALDEARAEAARQRARGDGSVTAEIEQRLQARERGMEELRDAAAAHAAEMRALEAKLDERDAYLAELEHDLEQAEKAHAQRRVLEGRVEAAETRERAARKRVAELEGLLVRDGRVVPPAAVEAAPAPAAQVEDGARPELEAQIEKLKAQVADAQREAWAQVKARSDAEAQAAEVREDTVRKLKDARKIANVELMRAMEEATKKAVSLKEELARTEAERKQALAELRAARERLPRGDVPGAEEIRAELERIEQLVVGEGARLGGIEEGLRRAVAAVAAAEFGYERAP